MAKIRLEVDFETVMGDAITNIQVTGKRGNPMRTADIIKVLAKNLLLESVNQHLNGNELTDDVVESALHAIHDAITDVYVIWKSELDSRGIDDEMKNIISKYMKK